MTISISSTPTISFSSGRFPGGEVKVQIDVEALSIEDYIGPHEVEIEATIRNSDDVMELLMVTDALRRIGVETINLTMPYLPYARQDRVTVPGESHSLRVFSDLINSQNYKHVTVWDVHSDVALATINNVINFTQDVFLNKVIPGRSSRTTAMLYKPVLVAPDAGAIKKTAALAKIYDCPYVRADKTRDPATGKLTGAVVYTQDIENKEFLIVDDICDGGRTFLTLCELLRRYTTGKVSLYVTHGIFSGGYTELAEAFDDIYVANLLNLDLNVPDNFHII